MKIGDKIRRKDMPSLVYTILAESDEWKGYWRVESYPKIKKSHLILTEGIIGKDDTRWEVVK